MLGKINISTLYIIWIKYFWWYKFEDIKKYCKTHAYELVFFCRDVEEVYLGKRVNDKDKVNEVKRFKSKKMIEAVLPQNLSQNEYKINGSNILNVLDKFWTRKN